MLTDEETRFFQDGLARCEAAYLAGTNPRQQSGFGRGEQDWERYRRIVTAPIDRSGTFLDIGCANGLLMESVAEWTIADGHPTEPYGVDISPKLAELARRRLPHWRERIFVGNALVWAAPFKFDFVRTELVYVPAHLRHRYTQRLLADVVAPGGCLIVCTYGSSRVEGARAEVLLDELQDWGLPVASVHDAVSDEYGFVVTRVVALRAP
jgi:SAM-dependent methyltransferase